MRCYCQNCGRMIYVIRGNVEDKMREFRENPDSLVFGIVCRGCESEWKELFEGRMSVIE